MSGLSWADRKKDHIDQAEHNRELYDIIEADLNPAFLDWAITAIFYACVHYVDARLTAFQLEPADHKQRHEYVDRHLSDIKKPYHRTYKESRSSRYDPQYRSLTNIAIVKSFEYKMAAIRGSVLP